MSAPIDLAPILERLANGTPGPWYRVPFDECPDGAYTDRLVGAHNDGGVVFIADAETDADADLIAHAPADLAALAARVAELEAENARLLKALTEAKAEANDWALEACIVGGHDVPSELGEWTGCWSGDFGKGFNGWQLTMGEYVATVQDPKDAPDCDCMAEWKIWQITLEGPVELEGRIDWGDRGMVVRAMRDAKAALDALTAATEATP